MRKLHSLILYLTLAAPLGATSLPLPVPPPPVIAGARVTTIEDSVLFQTWFVHNIDLQDHDQFNRAAESFQWYLTTDQTDLHPANKSSILGYVVRPDNYLITQTVNVCGVGKSDNTCPGGWGPAMGDFDTWWDETGAFSFELPVSLFGTTDIRYDLLSFRYGAFDDEFDGASDGRNAQRYGPENFNSYYTNFTPPAPDPQPNTDPVGFVPLLITEPAPGPVSTPEPSSLLLLLPACFAIIWIRKSRKV